MDRYAARLAGWLRAHDVDAEHRVFAQSTHSVAEAAAAAGAGEEEFVKSICLLTQGEGGEGGEGEGRAGGEGGGAGPRLLVAVVKGEDRASTSRVQAVLALRLKPRLATADEMLALTGYPAGGTPPFGFEATFLVDERVMERAHVWGGGGSDRALVRVAPAEMLRTNGGRVARVRR